MARTASDLAERFWAHVTREGPDDCWLKNGATFTNGYGAFRWGDRNVKAHRMAYWLTYGFDSIADNQQLRHLCESRYARGDMTYKRCCNPSHLVPGSAKENADDRERNGRQGHKRGTDRYWSVKLTEDQVHAIRRRFASGTFTQQQLADEFGVTQTAIGHIVRYVAWTHLQTPDAPPIRSRRQYDPAEIEAMRQMRAEGHGYQSIATAFGVTNTGTVYRLIAE